MPRKLPWLTDQAIKKESTPAPISRKRASSDLVDSDLDDVNPAPRKTKRSFEREPSSSPPRAPPTKLDVEYMKDGFGSDDIFMMVEDEFDSTARLFTQHIHYEEYVKLKRVHRARGADRLAQLSRGTDGTTQQSKGLRMRLEKEEMAKKRKLAAGDVSEDEESEDDDMDPSLAGLMSASQLSGPTKALNGYAKARSTTRAAHGCSQSPWKKEKFRDALAGKRHDKPKQMVSDPDDDETDEELPSSEPPVSGQRQTYTSISKAEGMKAPPPPPRNTGIFKQFAKPAQDQSRPTETKVEASSRKTNKDEDTTAERTTSRTSTAGNITITKSKGGKGSKYAQMLAKPRNVFDDSPEPSPPKVLKKEVTLEVKKERVSPVKPTTCSTTYKPQYTASKPGEIKREDKGKQKKVYDDIPTFLF